MDILLENVLKYEQPTKYIVKSENYSDDFALSVLTAGKSFVLGYTDETEGVCKASESPVIIFDDFTADCKYVDFDFKVKSSAMKILHKVNAEDNLKYYFYAMQAIDYTPFSHKRVWISEYSKFKIENRSVAEQNNIVKDLDTVTTAIDNAKQRLNALDELVKSRFIEMFGDVDKTDSPYKICKLNDVANVGSSHRVFTTEFVEKGIPFYLGTEIGELANGKRPANPFYISEEHYQRLACDSTKPKIGDLLIPSICNKAQVWMVDTDEPFYYKDGRVLCISPNLSVFNPLYLLHFMRFKTEIEYQKLDSAPTFSEFKIFILKNFDVIVPPMSIQNELADFVKLIDKS